MKQLLLLLFLLVIDILSLNGYMGMMMGMHDIMKKCLNNTKKMIFFTYNLTKIQTKVILNFNMGNIG